MPSITPDIEIDDCICALVRLRGQSGPAYTATFAALLNQMIIALTALKTYIIMFNVDFEYRARLLVLEAELALVNETISTFDAPFNQVLGYTRLLSDCDPVASLAETIKGVRDKILTPAKEKQFEIEQTILALEKSEQEIETIDRWIDLLNEIGDALQACGEE